MAQDPRRLQMAVSTVMQVAWRTTWRCECAHPRITSLRWAISWPAVVGLVACTMARRCPRHLCLCVRAGLMRRVPAYVRRGCPRKSQPSSRAVRGGCVGERSSPRSPRHWVTSGLTACARRWDALPVLMQSSPERIRCTVACWARFVWGGAWALRRFARPSSASLAITGEALPPVALRLLAERGHAAPCIQPAAPAAAGRSPSGEAPGTRPGCCRRTRPGCRPPTSMAAHAAVRGPCSMARGHPRENAGDGSQRRAERPQSPRGDPRPAGPRPASPGRASWGSTKGAGAAGPRAAEWRRAGAGARARRAVAGPR